ncbi:response regulator [Sinomicrobium weinanense]|uniref:Response regulator transcription factor n=1 Tax=Sinomicrobium weinanense TaxID=2842200 RepID=A0A926JRW9_9FLAO|nr:response regulator transcription factor [Sinomicrobium weinanense]MBC9796333.1 response regulator transcription factor [Sinomicrobium weinanense]MBU3122465.1 response regulator transcription factor [Sinomicrobium weinanense]
MNNNGIAIVDDHLLFAQSLISLVSTFNKYKVLFHALNGKEFITEMENRERVPDLVLLDINMPVMDGLETMAWIKQHNPELKVLALSIDDREETIIKMLRLGARGYVLKDIHPDIFKKAVEDVLTKGFYFSDRITNTILDSIDKKEDTTKLRLKEREMEFLKLACTERTYKEIAENMFLSPKTIDGYREVLFEKLEVKSRVGLVLYAIKHKLIEV